MKTKNYLMLILFGLFIAISCEKETIIETIVIIQAPEGSDSTETAFIAAEPDLNAGTITFEATGPSFELANVMGEDRIGTWGRFGENGDDVLIAEYADNPESNSTNSSARVIKVTEPAGLQPWSGFYFKLSETITFPEGQEAIAIDFHSPGPGHNVVMKLENNLANGVDGKKSTPDLNATTTGTGWETLVFNVNEIAGERDGIYDIMTFILGFGITNDAQAIYYMDNVRLSDRAVVVIPDAPTSAPNAPTYGEDTVISVFSDAYTDIAGTDFNPAWGQSTVVTTESIADNNVLKYATLNYQGIALGSTTDVSAKTKLHLDYFSGDATQLQVFLIGSDGVETAFSIDPIGTAGEWNSVDIALTEFTGVNLSEIIQLKIVGNGSVYLDNIYFYGGGSGSGTDYAPTYGGTFDGTTIVGGVYTFPAAAQAWAGFSNTDTSIYPLSFEHGGRITFTAAAISADVDVNFRFERLAYPDVDPAFSTANVTISGSTETSYTVEIAPQDAGNTYSSTILYLVTRDAGASISNISIRSYDAPASGTNYSPAYDGTFDGTTVVGGVYTFPAAAQAWAGFSNTNTSIYPMAFPNGGRITFTAAAVSTDVDVNFRFERLAYPDVDPAFSTANMTISGTTETSYTVEIPPQDSANTYSSTILYLVTRDAGASISNIVITAFD